MTRLPATADFVKESEAESPEWSKSTRQTSRVSRAIPLDLLGSSLKFLNGEKKWLIDKDKDEITPRCCSDNAHCLTMHWRTVQNLKFEFESGRLVKRCRIRDADQRLISLPTADRSSIINHQASKRFSQGRKEA